MHRSSELIGTIAAALARAQTQLINPEKSLVATIRSPFPRESDRSFRYAPLSTGLDIIRKSLGQHEIATFQTTTIDQDAGLVRLTTMLAHSSGEWVSSEWPVCPIADTASPQRMGAALTYARRYALFTLVGIAGEDDLDAPDLDTPARGAEDNPGTAQVAQRPIKSPSSPSKPGNGVHRKPMPRRSAPVLAPPESTTTRARLIEKLATIASGDALTEWAVRHMAVKNTLAPDDAAAVEAAFRNRLDQATRSEPPLPHTSVAVVGNDNSPTMAAAGTERVEIATGPVDARSSQRAADFAVPNEGVAEGIDKSLLAIGEPRRYRDKGHLKFVASQACLICGRQPSDPHHLRFVQPRALGRKVSDEFVVPLCRTHHREVHRCSNEARWWATCQLDPRTVASTLWARTRLGPSVAPRGEPREPKPRLRDEDSTALCRTQAAPKLPNEANREVDNP